MKRIHLFEFEDFPWFPNWIRKCMTRYIVAFHRVLGTDQLLAALVARALQHTSHRHIIDLCSGSGGPMPAVVRLLRDRDGLGDLKLSLSDLFPNHDAAAEINGGKSGDNYITTPVDATNIGQSLPGVRTLVCSLHHMKPELARSILKDAKESRQPICIYEISDNAAPRWLWWLAIPPAFIMTLFVTPLVRPFTIQQLVFTYLIPILPLFIAWDGAVSNARTYTLHDLDVLLEGLQSADYKWEKGVVKSRLGNNLYLLGLPGG